MRQWQWLIAATGLGLLAWSCGDDETSSSQISGTSVNTGTGASSAGGSTSVGTGIGGAVSVGVGTGGSCARTCTADLKSIVDCNGVVIDTCPGDEACLNGACVNDPCGAAEASKSSYGCDYWAVKPDLITAGRGACFAAYVANTWSSPVHIELSRNGNTIANTGFIQIPQGQGQGLTYAPYDDVAGLPVGEVAIVFLAHEDPPQSGLPICPVPAAVNAEAGVRGTDLGSAFNIVTDRPVVAYSIMPYGGGPSAATSSTLLLPTSAWDDNYIAVNAYAAGIAGQPSLNILAREANTVVTVLPKVAIVGGANVIGGPANTPVVYTLNAGEYVQITQQEELTGSVISADKPIGLWGAASCLNVPINAGACDSAHQQIPPINALGSRYAGVRYRNRTATEESPPWRMVGAVDGTQLTWIPSAPTGAPSVLNRGDVAEFEATGPFVVESQDDAHPFYASQYMTGAEVNGGGFGDPEWVNIVPTEQYLDDYVFFTDPTYPETSLVVVRKRSTATGMFDDVTLDCAGVLSGWQPIGTDLEYTRVDLVTGNFQDVGMCSNGRHEMSSDTPFGVTVWGWGSGAVQGTGYVSYAYPAGASVQPINDVVVPPTPN